MTAAEIKTKLSLLENPETAESSRRFFKTGPGEYGEGDRFRGIRVPVLRKLAKDFRDTSLEEAEKLLHSEYHEDRLLALFLLVNRFRVAGEAGKQKIYQLYLKNIRFVNNWDLVDSSADKIAGEFLLHKGRDDYTNWPAQMIFGRGELQSWLLLPSSGKTNLVIPLPSPKNCWRTITT